MKKIIILALHLGYGGIERSIASLANLLAKDKNYSVRIVSIYKLYEKIAFELDDSVKITYLLPSNLSPNKDEWYKTLRSFEPINFVKESFKSLEILYKRRKVVIDYLKMSDADVIISTRIMLNELLGEFGKNDIVKIGWEHNHHHNNMRYATDVIRSSKNLDYLVLVSNDLFKFYKRKMVNYKCRCVLIPNVIEHIPKRLSKVTTKRLISVGRLSKEKGYFDLLKIYKELKDMNCDWHLDIVGDGSERSSLEKYIRENDLGSNVTLHGFKNSKEVEKLMLDSSIYIMTSYTESFGIVLLEAMSCGLPCVAFDSAEGAKEIITSGYDGYLIRNRNFKAMEKKIMDLINDFTKRRELGKNGRFKVKNYMSDTVKSKWENIIEKK